MTITISIWKKGSSRWLEADYHIEIEGLSEDLHLLDFLASLEAISQK